MDADIITETVRYFKRVVEDVLGDDLDVEFISQTTSASGNVMAGVPVLVFQGPKIEPFGKDFTVEEEIVGQTGDGVNIIEQKKARLRVNLRFRVRLFTKNKLDSWRFIGMITKAAMKITKIEVPNIDESVTFSGNDPVNITIRNHRLSDGDSAIISESSDTGALPNGVYTITRVDDDNVTVPFNGTGFGGTCTATYGVDQEYGVSISEDFDPDTIPNFSDLDHHESYALIEDVVIETDETEQVYERVGPVNVEFS